MKRESELQTFLNLPAPILTAYVNTSCEDATHHPLVSPAFSWFEKAATAHFENLPVNEKRLFQHQAGRVARFLLGRHPKERALVIFAGPKTWKLLSTQAPVQNEIHWGKPDLVQLLQIRGENPPYGVVVVTHSAARFLRYQLGDLTLLAEKPFVVDVSQWKKKDQGHVATERVQKTRGPQRDIYEHRMEAQYARLCRQTAQQALALLRQHDFAALFLVGPSKLIRAIHDHLPQSVCESVVLVNENFGKHSTRTLLKQLQPFFDAYGLHHETAAVERVQAGGASALTNFDEVLTQAQEGKIHTLLVPRTLNPELQQCTVCGMANRSADPVCSYCRGPRKKVMLHELLARLAETQHVKLEFVGETAADLLQKTGGLAGWTRPAKSAAD